MRSIPAQNVPPAPVSTMTWTSLRSSSSSKAAAMLAATAWLMALRACGRLIVTTAIVVVHRAPDHRLGIVGSWGVRHGITFHVWSGNTSAN